MSLPSNSHRVSAGDAMRKKFREARPLPWSDVKAHFLSLSHSQEFTTECADSYISRPLEVRTKHYEGVGSTFCVFIYRKACPWQGYNPGV